jgi:hypothetical protein
MGALPFVNVRVFPVALIAIAEQNIPTMLELLSSQKSAWSVAKPDVVEANLLMVAAPAMGLLNVKVNASPPAIVP